MLGRANHYVTRYLFIALKRIRASSRYRAVSSWSKFKIVFIKIPKLLYYFHSLSNEDVSPFLLMLIIFTQCCKYVAVFNIGGKVKTLLPCPSFSSETRIHPRLFQQF